MKLFKSYFKIAAACTSFLILGSFSEHHSSAHIPEAKINSSTIEDGFVLRINSGGSELNIGNQKFVKDEYYAGDSKIFSNTSIEDIGDTTYDALYLT
ncbi:MAG: hypothetical protein WA951_09780, partial [Leeuwenhoekiella sp.]